MDKTNTHKINFQFLKLCPLSENKTKSGTEIMKQQANAIINMKNTAVLADVIS